MCHTNEPFNNSNSFLISGRQNVSPLPKSICFVSLSAMSRHGRDMPRRIKKLNTKGGEEMGFIIWSDEKIKKLDVIDIQFIKLSAMAFILLVAKLWPPLLNLEWYWYALILILAVIKPLAKVFNK